MGLRLSKKPTGAKGRLIHLTPGGLAAQRTCLQRLAQIDRHWKRRFGGQQIADLRESLQAVIHYRDGDQPALS